MKRIWFLIFAAVCACTGILIFQLISKYYLAFPAPWPSTELNFVGGLGQLLMLLSSAVLIVGFVKEKSIPLVNKPAVLPIWSILGSLAFYYLQIVNLNVIGWLPFATENIANSINNILGVLLTASYVFVVLFFLRHIKRPFAALVVSWLVLLIWDTTVLGVVTFLLDTLFGAQEYFTFWQLRHPEWFISYWPAFLGMGFVVAASWFVHQQSVTQRTSASSEIAIKKW